MYLNCVEVYVKELVLGDVLVDFNVICIWVYIFVFLVGDMKFGKIMLEYVLEECCKELVFEGYCCFDIFCNGLIMNCIYLGIYDCGVVILVCLIILVDDLVVIEFIF